MKRLLTTSLLAASTYGLTLLASTPAASADTPGGGANADTPVVLSPATAALADGDDIRARFILQTRTESFSPIETTAAPDLAALSPLTAALGDGDDIRMRELADIQH
ncbi:MAG: hypothetical protein JO023_27760 [Chloroflexi bacterium]|nr:hypothetical protein [Chloroflexota bacterium]